MAVRLSPPASLALRTETDDDARFLAALHASTRPDLAALGPAGEPLLAMQHSAREQQYRAAHPQARFWIVLHEERPIGRLVVDAAVDPIVLVDLALLPEARGHGLGTQLLAALGAAADADDRALRLHVSATSPAQRLYRRAGFVERDRTELNVVMERPTRSACAG